MYITEEHIKNHFIVNPEWKKLFFTHYKDFNQSNYTDRTKKVFEKNGYSFKTIQPFKSKRFNTVREVEMYKGEEWIVAFQGFNERNALEQLFIDIICDYETVDLSTFK